MEGKATPRYLLSYNIGVVAGFNLEGAIIRPEIH